MSKNLLFLLAGAAGGDVRGGGWILLLGGASAELSGAVHVDDSDNCYLAADTQSEGAGGRDVYIAKIDVDGAVTWQRRIGGAQNDRGRGVCTDGSGNVYVAGSVATTGANGAFLAKYNSSGTLQWQRRLHTGSTNTPYFTHVSLGADGYLYLNGGGTVASSGADLLAAKYDVSGSLQWQRRLYGPTTTNDTGYPGCIDSSDNLITVGGTAAGTCVTAKYDSGGTLQWQRELDGAGLDILLHASVDATDDIYVCGIATLGGVPSGVLAKYNPSGAIQWQQTLSLTEVTYLWGCAVDGDGNVLVVGQHGAAGFEVGVIAKYEPDGTLVWQKAVSPASGMLVLNCISVKDNVAWIGGYTTGDGAGSDDLIVLKIPTDLDVDGTYGAFSIGALTLTSAAGTLTDSAGSLTGATTTLTNASTSLTAATATLTAELILIE